MGKKVCIGLSAVVAVVGIIKTVHVAMNAGTTEFFGPIPILFFGGIVLMWTSMVIGAIWGIYAIYRVNEIVAIVILTILVAGGVFAFMAWPYITA